MPKDHCGESPVPSPAFSPKGERVFDFPRPVAGRGQGEGECRLLRHRGGSRPFSFFIAFFVDGRNALLGRGLVGARVV